MVELSSHAEVCDRCRVFSRFLYYEYHKLCPRCYIQKKYGSTKLSDFLRMTKIKAFRSAVDNHLIAEKSQELKLFCLYSGVDYTENGGYLHFNR